MTARSRRSFRNPADGLLEEVPGGVLRSLRQQLLHAGAQPPLLRAAEREIPSTILRSAVTSASSTTARQCSPRERMLLQTYVRDTGEVLCDLSFPIVVGNRRWGVFRIGFAPSLLGRAARAGGQAGSRSIASGALGGLELARLSPLPLKIACPTTKAFLLRDHQRSARSARARIIAVRVGQHPRMQIPPDCCRRGRPPLKARGVTGIPGVARCPRGAGLDREALPRAATISPTSIAAERPCPLPAQLRRRWQGRGRRSCRARRWSAGTAFSSSRTGARDDRLPVCARGGLPRGAVAGSGCGLEINEDPLGAVLVRNHRPRSSAP